MTDSVFRSLDEARGRFGPCALAIGNFDGVHIGHQALLSTVVRFANQHRLVPAALTFHPHPASIVAPERTPQEICSLETRIRLLQAAGARQVFVLPFTPEVAHMSPEEFVSQILVSALAIKAVFVGENFRFGYRQSGTTESLRELGAKYNFDSHFIAPVTYRGQLVSSSAIRNYLASTNVSRAARLLGRCFSLIGPVVAGEGVGSKKTVPTLNVRPESDQLVPRGVYITETLENGRGRRWPSITNAGVRPTFGGQELVVETFLLGPLNGPDPENIDVRFQRFVRAERQFPNPEALKTQILKDISRAQTWWRRVSHLPISVASIY